MSAPGEKKEGEPNTGEDDGEALSLADRNRKDPFWGKNTRESHQDEKGGGTKGAVKAG